MIFIVNEHFSQVFGQKINWRLFVVSAHHFIIAQIHQEENLMKCAIKHCVQVKLIKINTSGLYNHFGINDKNYLLQKHNYIIALLDLRDIYIHCPLLNPMLKVISYNTIGEVNTLYINRN